ncbi:MULTISPECIES: hypothetical protein [unclassified Streptomyces]|uniref:hypothetical protein n=1 Tax=unclassified Streptomyces TaxID=2593676 RepID=UPI002258D0D1|nr:MULTISPECIES: hypothetical protein [unclassified Streptomyces]MCX5329546.1 hypothetical protein [Streptomyces sp. NBC_00140]MCX5358962.1 hypothetical protein [Streptomyces sp. NBC_00124]
MADHHGKGPGDEPVPRDMPDQQAGEGEDPWDADPEAADTEEPDAEVPDTDEAGTGRQGAPRQAGVHSEHPVPEEPSG